MREAFYFDQRKVGKADLALGTDRDEAIKQWHSLMAGMGYTRHKKSTKAPPKLTLEPRRAGKRRAFPSGAWADVPQWARRMYLSAEKRMTEKGGVNMLRVDEFKAIVYRANGRCELTGLELDQTGKGRRPLAPSIDRIDASVGYIAGNVRIVCLMANQALSEWGEAPVLALAQALLRKRELLPCGSDASETPKS